MVTFDILGKHNNFSSIDDTEERKVALIAIYSNLSQEIIDEDDKFLKDALIEYFPPNEANDWLERPRVYGVKDLAGNDLDLKRRCFKINGKANTILLKLKNEIFPPTKATIDDADADAEESEDQSAEYLNASSLKV